MKARRCLTCVQKHRTCVRDGGKDEPCQSCKKLGVECVTKATRPTPGGPGKRGERGYRIELARALFGGEPRADQIKSITVLPEPQLPPLGEQPEPTSMVTDGFPTPPITTISEPYPPAPIQIKNKSQELVSVRSNVSLQNTRPSSTENCLRQSEIAGKLRMELIIYSVEDVLAMAGVGQRWVPKYYRAKPQEIAGILAQIESEFIHKYEQAGMNPDAEGLGPSAELRASIFVLNAAVKLSGLELADSFGAPSCSPIRFQARSIEEFQRAARTSVEPALEGKYRALGHARESLLRSAWRDCARLVEQDFHGIWQTGVPGDLDLSNVLIWIQNVADTGHSATHEDVRRLWDMAVAMCHRLLQSSETTPNQLRSTRTAAILDRLVAGDARRAAMLGKNPDISEQVLLNLMSILHPPAFARLALSFDGNVTIPIPNTRAEQVSLLWITLIASHRMMGCCAVSIQSASLGTALDILERMWTIWTTRQQWYRECCTFLPSFEGGQCPRCGTRVGPCTGACAEEEASIRGYDQQQSACNLFRLFQMIESVGLQRQRAVSSDPTDWGRWNHLHSCVKAETDEVVWATVDRLVRPPSLGDALDLSRKTYILGLGLLAALDVLPGGIAYLVHESASLQEPEMCMIRQAQILGIRTILVHLSSQAGLWVERLANLDDALSAAALPSLAITSGPQDLSASTTA